MSPAAPAARPGRLTIYVGAAPGVGKTYKMLQDAHVVKSQGFDVVIGWLDTHGRRETAEQVGDLERIPPKRVVYQGHVFEEMDLAAILRRHPQIALVDELAHTNVPEPGAHEKRYQDIEDLLAAGIDVVTTVNIQHLESLYDKVAHITGVAVRERVPDHFLRRAREIKLVDASPETLQERLRQGKIYAPEKVDAALNHFFQLGRLAALRELALVEVANRVEPPVSQVVGEAASARREKILVCVSGGPQSETLIRRGWRIADRLQADLTVLLIRPTSTAGDAPDERALTRIRQLSAQFGATLLVRDSPRPLIGATIVRVAQELGVSQIVIGQPPPRPGLWGWRRRSPVDVVLAQAEFVDLHVVGRITHPQDT
ncbi:MAG: sensor histidine kinase KdpD [Firmicutes bacterium]|nr:sensor histidine kinase KdpD [Bacillota bacterium]